MDPVTLTLISAAITSIGEIVNQLGQGKITDAQAQAALQGAVTHYNAARAAWDAAGSH